MTTATQVLDTIRSYLGVAEDPPHSNQTIIGEKFGWNGVPWCAETVTVCQHEAGNTAFKGSASCSQLVAWYQDGTNGEWLGNPGADGLQPGDEFFLGSRGQDHTGLVESVNGNTVITVEGNWGDKVARVSRPVSAFYGFGRPNYTAPPQGDSDLTDEEHTQLWNVRTDVDIVAQKVDQTNQRLDTVFAKLDQIIKKVGA